MTGYRTRATEMRQGFLVQLGVFLIVNVAFALYTLIQGGDFWWFPITVIWGGAVAGYGTLTYGIWRRERWEDETHEQRQRLFAPPNPLD